MKQVLVDMDGVLADVYAQFIRLEKEESGLVLMPGLLSGKTEAEAFPHYKKHVNSAGFFRMAPLIPGSVEGLKYLNDKYSVLIVSSATEYPDSLKEKLEWLNEFYPFISWQQMIFCGEKDSIQGDIMIDDHPKNLNNFKGQRIIFTQPHNINLPDTTWHRVTTWQEIVEIL